MLKALEDMFCDYLQLKIACQAVHLDFPRQSSYPLIGNQISRSLASVAVARRRTPFTHRQRIGSKVLVSSTNDLIA